MAKRKTAGNKKTKQAGNGENGGIISLTKELFQAAITLRGSVEPADYKRYVLPIIFLRFLSLRYDRRRAEIEALVVDKKSDYFGDKKAIHDPDEYRRVGAFVIPEAARWENLRKAAQAAAHVTAELLPTKTHLLAAVALPASGRVAQRSTRADSSTGRPSVLSRPRASRSRSVALSRACACISW